MKILAIETSCDDTSIALVEASQKKGQKIPEIKVLKNLVSSQTAIHSHWGGVVPSLAKREHLKNLPKVYNSLVASGQFLVPDFIAVTTGPGLEPSLWTGIEFAKKISEELKIPLVGVNHLEGHLYSFLLPKKTVITNNQLPIPKDGLPKTTNYKLPTTNFPAFPAISLLVSGGHTILTLMKDLTHWEKLGETRDDAAGEAYDKVAKMMGLPYPGGPEIEKLAAQGDPNAIKFPRPMIHEKNYEFSFSGLKTAVLYYLKNNNFNLSLRAHPKQSRIDGHSDPANAGEESNKEPDEESSPVASGQSLVANIAASFQAAAIEVLVKKTMRAVRAFGAKSVFLCGGVAANKTLRHELEKHAEQNGAQFFAPDFEYNTDNAAMIAVSAYMRKKSRRKAYSIEADPNLSL